MATERQAEAVTMEDGRQVEFVGKRKMLKSTEIADGRVTTRLDFRNGRSLAFTIPGAMLLQFAGHGAEQKLGDETAGEEDVDDMVLAVESLIERLNRGEWSVKREGGGFSGTSVLLRALVERTGKPVDGLKAWLATKSQAEKIALRNSAALKPIVQRLEEEKASKNAKVDTESLLGELA